MHLAIVASCLVLIISIVYIYVKCKYQFWLIRNVAFIEPRFPYGSVQELRVRYQMSQLLHKFYKQLKGTGVIGGFYIFLIPVVLLIDLDLLKNVLIKDFDHFTERGAYYNEKDDPLSAHLLTLEEPKWRCLRQKLTPTFTSAKMKFMFPTIVEVASRFQECLTKLTENNDVLELKDLLARFTTDIIGTCAFGIDCNSLNDPNAEFRVMGKNVFGAPRNSNGKSILMAAFRPWARRLRMKTVRDDVSKFFLGIVRETIEHREQNNVHRNDFMDLLMQLKSNGKLDGDLEPDVVGKLSVEEIAAQAYVFFLAGFETSSTSLSYTLYELAVNQDIQDKARHEINSVLEQHDNQLSYDAMQEMHYLDQIIKESLRKYPPAAHTVRQVTEDYCIPNTAITLPKGMRLMVPIYAIHHDPDYYPEPEIFDPSRFLPELVEHRHPMAYMPFGEGPRNCIGSRFGLMQIRIGLITLLKRFQFRTCAQTTIPIVFAKKGLILTIDGGLYLSVVKI